jgi:membrane protein DedA with SNARE-associated domain
MLDSGIIANFVKEWGYVAVFLGSIVEGEVVLLTASASATLGYLSISKIFIIAFLTTVVVDQILFFVGYRIGTDWLVRKVPKVGAAKDRVFKLLHQMDIFFIFAFRFIYGIRTISPLIIGSAKIKPAKFVVFNILSGFCWAFICCFIGYTVADMIIDGKFDAVPVMIAISIVIALISLVITIFTKRRKL